MHCESKLWFELFVLLSVFFSGRHVWPQRHPAGGVWQLAWEFRTASHVLCRSHRRGPEGEAGRCNVRVAQQRHCGLWDRWAQTLSLMVLCTSYRQCMSDNIPLNPIVNVTDLKGWFSQKYFLFFQICMTFVKSYVSNVLVHIMKVIGAQNNIGHHWISLYGHLLYVMFKSRICIDNSVS